MNFTDLLGMGWEHILNFSSYDHILFIVVLCALFKLNEWKKILVIVTAFTIGHSVTLILSALDLILIPAKVVEVLIPLTIVFTAITNILQNKEQQQVKTFDRKLMKNYLLAMTFGFIHGMGFANTIKMMIGDEPTEMVKQLFAFNLGIELGQVMIVLCILIIYFILERIFRIRHREWNIFLSGAGFGVGGVLLISNILNYQ